MASSVDTRVVQMEFDNSDFKERIKETLENLLQMREALSGAIDTKGIQDAVAVSNNMKLDGISSALDDVQEKFSFMGVLALNVMNKISNAVIDTGQKIVNAFAIEPIKQGFEEYELELGAVQTIVASTGESTQRVYRYLDMLNTYADKTIYSFSDMTQSIGKFTNAGVDLDRAVSAIQGIANEAAVSGANTNEASRAMYNFAQALSAGAVKLIDWKSIENANMATVEFKQELINTALTLGTLEKTEEGFVSTTKDMQGKVSDAFTATHAFNDSLSAQWMTTDVLVEALSHYSTDVRDMTNAEKKAYEERLRGLGYNNEQIKQIEELGKKAYDAAQDVKSFSQLIDTLKEAAGSGWTMTWKLIFGDLEEAKQLWTGVSEVVSNFIGGINDWRNEVLQYWHDVGGRANVLQGLANVFEYLGKVMKLVGMAFTDVFGVISSKQAAFGLDSLSLKFRQWSENLKIGHEHSLTIIEAFKGLFSVIKAVGTVLGGVFEGAMSIVVPLVKTFIDILTTGGGIIGRFAADLTDSGNAAEFIADKFRNVGNFVGGFIEDFRKGVPTIADFDNALGGLKEKLSGVGNVVKEVVKVLGSGFLDVINTLKPGVSEFLGNLGLGDLFAMWNAQGAVSIAQGLIGIKKSIDEFLGGESWIKEGFESIKGVMESLKETLKAYQTQLNAKTLLTIGLAVAALAVSMAILSQVDAGALAKSGIAIYSMMFALVSAMKTLEKYAESGKGMAAMAPTIVAFAGAILLLALSMALLSLIKTENLVKGGVAIGFLVGALIVFMQSMDGLQSKSGKIIAIGGAMMLLAGAVMGLAVAIAILSLIPAEKLGTALVGLGAGLLILGIALELMTASTKGAKALAIAAVAIMLLTPSLLALSLVPVENICNALGILGGAILILGASAAMLEPALPAMLVLGYALALIGIGAAGLGIGLLAIGTAFNIISVTGAGAAFAVSKVLEAIILGIASTIPQVATALAEGFASFIETIASNATRIVEAVKTLALSILDGIKTIVPEIAETGLTIIDEFVSSLAEHLPSIAESGISMIVSLIKGITEGLPQIIEEGFQAAIAFVNGLADSIREHHEEMYEAGANLFTAILEALMDLVGDIVDGVAELGSQIIDEVTGWWDSLWGASNEDGKAIEEGIKEGGGGAREAAKETMEDTVEEIESAKGDLEDASDGAGSSAADGFLDTVGAVVPGAASAMKNVVGEIDAAAPAAESAGKNVGSGEVKGANAGLSNLSSTFKGKTQGAVDDAKSVNSYAAGDTVGSNYGSGVSAGIGKWIGSVVEKAKEMVSRAKTAANKEQDSASPSKDMMKVGGWFAQGYAIGIEKTISDVAGSAGKMVSAAKDEVIGSGSAIYDLMDGIDWDSQPTIRPVLDTSNIDAGMDRIFAQRQMLQAGWIGGYQGDAYTSKSAILGNTTTNYSITLDYNAGEDPNTTVQRISDAIRARNLMKG